MDNWDIGTLSASVLGQFRCMISMQQPLFYAEDEELTEMSLPSLFGFQTAGVFLNYSLTHTGYLLGITMFVNGT